MSESFYSSRPRGGTEQLSFILNVLKLDEEVDRMVYDCLASGEYKKMQALEGTIRLLLIKVTPFAYSRPGYKNRFDEKVNRILNEMDANPRHQTNKYDDFQYFTQLILPLYKIIVNELKSVRGLFPMYGGHFDTSKGIIVDVNDSLKDEIEGEEDEQT